MDIAYSAFGIDSILVTCKQTSASDVESFQNRDGGRSQGDSGARQRQPYNAEGLVRLARSKNT